MLPLCYGVLELKPWEMDRLTPGEILDMYEGWVIRRRRQEELLAYFVTLPIYNSQKGKKDKAVTMEDIFGREDYVRRFGKSNKKPTEKEIYEDLFE